MIAAAVAVVMPVTCPSDHSFMCPSERNLPQSPNELFQCFWERYSCSTRNRQKWILCYTPQILLLDWMAFSLSFWLCFCQTALSSHLTKGTFSSWDSPHPVTLQCQAKRALSCIKLKQLGKARGLTEAFPGIHYWPASPSLLSTAVDPKNILYNFPHSNSSVIVCFLENPTNNMH
jgi:hypothetical protein